MAPRWLLLLAILALTQTALSKPPPPHSASPPEYPSPSPSPSPPPPSPPSPPPPRPPKPPSPPSPPPPSPPPLPFAYLASLEVREGGQKKEISVTPSFDPKTFSYSANSTASSVDIFASVCTEPACKTLIVNVNETAVEAGKPYTAWLDENGPTTIKIAVFGVGFQETAYTITVLLESAPGWSVLKWVSTIILALVALAAVALAVIAIYAFATPAARRPQGLNNMLVRLGLAPSDGYQPLP